MGHRADVIRAVDHALAVQKARRQLLIVARRSHRYHQGLSVYAQLQGLLDRHSVQRLRGAGGVA